MQQLSQDFVNTIQSYRSQGIAYKKIAKLLHASAANVYKYSKDIKLTKQQKQALLQNDLDNKQEFAEQFAVEKEVTIPSKMTPELARLLGHLFFDGSVYTKNGKYILDYTNSSKSSINNFIKLVENLFGLTSYQFRAYNRDTECYGVQFYSKKALDFVKTFSPTFSTKQNIGIPNQIMQASDECKIQFLKAFWDDEGSIGHNEDLSGSSKSEKMIDDLIKLHKNLGVKCSKTKSRFVSIIYIWVSGRNKFAQKIGFDYSVICRGYNKGKFKKTVLASFI